MMTHLLHSVALGLGAALLTACVGTIVGNPQDDDDAHAETHVSAETELQVDFAAYEAGEGGGAPTPITEPDQAHATSQQPLEGGPQLLEAWIALRDVTALQPDCASTAGVAPDTLVIDLMRGVEHPSAPLLRLDDTRVCALTLSFTNAETLPEGAPAGLAGQTLFFSGVRRDGTPFTISGQLSDFIDLRGEDAEPLLLTPGRDNLLLAFPLDTILRVASVDTVAPRASSVEINEGSNVDVYQRFVAAILTSSLLTRDANRDGVADTDELQAPLAGP